MHLRIKLSTFLFLAVEAVKNNDVAQKTQRIENKMPTTSPDVDNEAWVPNPP